MGKFGDDLGKFGDDLGKFGGDLGQSIAERRSFERRSEWRSQNGERERERRSEKNWWARARAALKK